MRLGLILFFGIGLLHVVQAQTYTGFIYDNHTKAPLRGVSVYFDGTTLGTITDENGYFQITVDGDINAPLMATFMGYAPFTIDTAARGGITHIYLKPTKVNLTEVVVVHDDWSPKKKWRYFRREFLGRTKAGRQSTIKNPEVIQLRYDKNDSILYAYADDQIQIQNDYLGYDITYNLVEFSVKLEPHPFKSEDRELYGTHVKWRGSSFFKETLADQGRIKKRRAKVYNSSLPRFMRAVKFGALEDVGYGLYHNLEAPSVSPNIVFGGYGIAGNTRFLAKLKTFYIQDPQGHISQWKTEKPGQTFQVDFYGIHTPWDQITFYGQFGETRIGDMLPLSYFPSNKKIRGNSDKYNP
jgi:hypothetical protein